MKSAKPSDRKAIGGLLASSILKQDALISQDNINQLFSSVVGGRSLVFFVGAGASTAGNTGMPGANDLIYQLLFDALVRSSQFDTERDKYIKILREISGEQGFEITLNDFWQICPAATSELYLSFAEVEGKCTPNCVHTFLAHWLATNGTVITTNYDRLIEREWRRVSKSIKVRYAEKAADSFRSWQSDLRQGACLFKIHGSLDRPESCLGALEHVRTRLVGDRADFLTDVMQSRPLCFVGWSGKDPDIPPLLSTVMGTRPSSLPIFWIHYEGHPPGSLTLDSSIQKTASLLIPLASRNPILADADRVFAGILQDTGIDRKPNPPRELLPLNFQRPLDQCTRAGASRMLAIALRRSGKLDLSRRVLDTALRLAETPEERSAAFQELSLLSFVEGKLNEARKWLGRARKISGVQPDGRLEFGVLSQTIEGLRYRPWLILLLPNLSRQYKQSIEAFRERSTDPRPTALHISLYHLCQGRLRLKLLGWLGRYVPFLTEWIMHPFEIARQTIEGAMDIHLHSHVDVLASRAKALSYFRRCDGIEGELSEIDRLVMILNDRARETYWKHQRRAIEEECHL